MTYKTLRNAWGSQKERFFVSYAVRGPMVDPSGGRRAGLPTIGPIEGPVSEPSPLNTEWRAEFDMDKYMGI